MPQRPQGRRLTGFRREPVGGIRIVDQAGPPGGARVKPDRLRGFPATQRGAVFGVAREKGARRAGAKHAARHDIQSVPGAVTQVHPRLLILIHRHPGELAQGGAVGGRDGLGARVKVQRVVAGQSSGARIGSLAAVEQQPFAGDIRRRGTVHHPSLTLRSGAGGQRHARLEARGQPAAKGALMILRIPGDRRHGGEIVGRKALPHADIPGAPHPGGPPVRLGRGRIGPQNGRIGAHSPIRPQESLNLTQRHARPSLRIQPRL